MKPLILALAMAAAAALMLVAGTASAQPSFVQHEAMMACVYPQAATEQYTVESAGARLLIEHCSDEMTKYVAACSTNYNASSGLHGDVICTQKAIMDAENAIRDANELARTYGRDAQGKTRRGRH